MTDFEPGLIEKLKADWPEVDVAEIAGRIGEDAANPSAVLTWRVKRQAVGGRSSASKPAETAPEHAGYFNLDGSWIATGDESDFFNAPPGSVTRFVRRMVWLKSVEQLGRPDQVVELVLQQHKQDAFPNWRRWALPPSDKHGNPVPVEDWWRSLTTSTAAEEAVKRG